MKVAIVGSRRHPNRQQIIDFVNGLPSDTIIVSGGADGVDAWAESTARSRGLKCEIYKPDYTGWDTLSYHEKCERYYKRNEQIVSASDKIVAFVMSDRRGGTENTLKHAKRMGKPYDIIYPKTTTDEGFI